MEELRWMAPALPAIAAQVAAENRHRQVRKGRDIETAFRFWTTQSWLKWLRQLQPTPLERHWRQLLLDIRLLPQLGHGLTCSRMHQLGREQ